MPEFDMAYTTEAYNLIPWDGEREAEGDST